MKILLLLAVTLVVGACTRASKQEVSTFKIDFSKIRQEKTSSLNALSSFPAGSNICYGINITAPDITSVKNECAPDLGVTFGFVSENSVLTAEVSFGQKRTVDIYAYLPKAGTACPTLDPVTKKSDISIDPTALYLVGKQADVTFDKAEMTLEVPVSFPGAAHSVYADLGLAASCLDSSTPNQPVVDPNAPVLLKTVFSNSTISSAGVDEYATLYLLVKATALPNTLNLILDGPAGNVITQNNYQMFYSCTNYHIATAGHICENATTADYYGQKSFTISQFAPNGVYTFHQLAVKDINGLVSLPVNGPQYTITNHPNLSSPPVITSIQTVADTSVSLGGGGNVAVRMLIASAVQPNNLERTLRGPGGTIINSINDPISAVNCSAYTSDPAQICYGYSSGYWQYVFNEGVSPYQMNGSYTITEIRIKNLATQTSAFYSGSPVSFFVNGNITPSTPYLNSFKAFYAFDGDALASGIPYYPTSCVRANEGMDLSLGLKMIVNSNVPINNATFDIAKPSSTIPSSSGTSDNDLGSNLHEVGFATNLYSINSSARGMYVLQNLILKNLGNVASSPVGIYGINVQDSCFTPYTSLSNSKDTHTCGLTQSGHIRCWGSNVSNKIDEGWNGNRRFPVVVDGMNQYQQISAGYAHTCGIRTGMTLVCWGENTYGQLGNGTTMPASVPVIADPGTQYSYVAAGLYSTCGVTTSGQLKCWGLNQNGILGDGTTTNKITPTVVSGGFTNFTKVSMGSTHTCAIRASGELYCWGANVNGQIGNGNTTGQTVPVIVNSGTSYQSVTAGNAVTCAVTTSGTLKCWGLNTSGQLGIGTSTGYQASPQIVDSGNTYMDISAGGNHICGVTTAGSLKCWGNNGTSQLGDGTATMRTSPTVVNSGQSYLRVIAGSSHSCGITTANQLKCWGNNISNQVGNGSTATASVPTLVDAP